MKKEPLVSLVIPSYNGKEMTVKLLESLKKTRYNNLDVVVVDNGSADGCYEYVKKHFHHVKVLKLEVNQGFTGGANYGIKNTEGEYIVMMNNDMILDPDWLTELVKVANSDKRIGIVASAFLNDDGTIDRLGYVESGGLVLKFKPLHRNAVYRNQFPPVLQVDHAFGLVKREVLDKIGVFDDKHFIYWEDVDLCYRARKAGFTTVIATRSKIFHKKSQTMKRFPYIRTYHYHKNKIRFIMKNMSMLRKIVNIPLTILQLIGESIVFVLKGEFRNSLAIYRAMIWNIKNLRDYL